MTNNKDIAIIGMSCIFPGAGNTQDFWNNITNKVDAVRFVPESRMDAVYFGASSGEPDRFYCRRGGFIDEYATFDPAQFGILPLAVEGTEPEQLLALRLAHQALKDAELLGQNKLHEKTGIIIGKGNYAGPGVLRAIEIIHTGQQLIDLLKDLMPGLGEEERQRIKKEFQAKKGRYAPDTVMGLIPNLVASLIANRLDLGGPAYTVDAACASSLIAIDHAVKELSLGNADLMIAGGIHACQNATFWSVFSQLGALSRSQQIRPFDRKADGLLIGEGCGFVVLKPLEKAIRDDNRIYAVIKGVGVSSDGSGTSVMSPSVHGQTKAIRQAWQNARLDTADIGYIEAHGTGTPLGDRIELETLTGVFGPSLQSGRRPKAGIGSVKSNIGHAMPAAGIAGLIKTTLALYHGHLPPTLHCDEPLDAMTDSGFEPIHETTDWKSTGIPTIAGVNAFGFGGINAHVVVQRFQETKTPSKSYPLSNSQIEKTDPLLLLSANDKESLLALLEEQLSTPPIKTHQPNAPYRLALFDPTPARIRMAIKIVGKDIPWRGKQDCWFTNAPLLLQGKKIAFLFPGLDGLDPDTANSTGVLDAALQLAQKTETIVKALARLNIVPHLHAGHSLGEWLAGYAAGWGEENDIIDLMRRLDPALFEEEGIAFLVAGCAMTDLETLLEPIGDIFLSNDNCPHQVILCGDETSIGMLADSLREKQIFHRLLPFSSGFHTPFLKKKLSQLQQAYKDLFFKKTSIPLWSATTLEPYPDDHEAICALGVRHLLEPVRFRELIDKLYEQDTRLFIQVGSGGLVGFVDDTLKGRSYTAISASSPLRSLSSQLQRVVAALFVEGREEAIQVPAPQPSKPNQSMQLQLGTPLLKKLDSFQQIAASIPKTAVYSSPILNAFMDSYREIEQIQSEIIQLFSQPQPGATASHSQNPTANHSQNPTASHYPNPAAIPSANPTTNPSAAPSSLNPSQNPTPHPSQPFQHTLNISLSTAPYLIDHSLFRQPPGWPHVEDKEPVIPMTMLLELLAETAEHYHPGSKVHHISDVKVLQWMSVVSPFRETIKGTALSQNTLHLDIEKYASANLSFTRSEEAPAETPFTDLGAPLPYEITPAEIYNRYMFHEAAYRGITRILRLAERGITGLIEGGAGKGSLLDNAGQLFGFWLQLILTKEKVAFPVKIREIIFYGDRTDQSGVFECTCLLTNLTEENATADFLLKKDGRIWALIKGWQDRRLELDDRFWNLAYAPMKNRLSEEIAPGIFYFNNAYNRVLSWEFASKRYFNKEEREYSQTLSPKKKREWIISRIAAKDAVRHKAATPLYPIEISIQKNEQGQPYPQGSHTENIHLSLAHKQNDAVAIASTSGPVGIDIESIEERDTNFIDLVLHPEEQALIAGRNTSEWITRCWTAKEAYGKYLGLGLQGSPLQYRITAIKGEKIIIENTVIDTFKFKNYIIGWTH